MHENVWSEKLKRQDLDVYGRIIFEYIFEKYRIIVVQDKVR